MGRYSIFFGNVLILGQNVSGHFHFQNRNADTARSMSCKTPVTGFMRTWAIRNGSTAHEVFFGSRETLGLESRSS